MIDRRAFLTALAALPACSKKDGPPTILLRSGWQTENIGDIAHTPGVLHLLEQHLPQAQVILWSNALDRGVFAMLDRRFPKMRIISGEPAELTDVFAQADFLLHGSGPSVVARDHLAAWSESTGKPYGIFGVTVSIEGEAASAALSPELRQTLEGAQFVFTRESASLANLRSAGIEGPQLDFVPDGTFSVDVRDDKAAQNFLEANQLEDKRFIAVIPRLRYTPYHEFKKVNWSAEKIARRTAVNAEHAEPDHHKLRQVIEAWLTTTGGQVLLCPEMTYQTHIIDPLLFDPLPDSLKPNIVRRKQYWLTDMAASVYARAAAVVSFECHSAIIAAAVGTPGLYVHQPEDGIKGRMWNDIGLDAWSFEVEETTGAEIADAVLAIHADPAAAQATLSQAVTFAHDRQAWAVGALRDALPNASLNEARARSSPKDAILLGQCASAG